MDCYKVIEQLSEYADGILPEVEASIIKEHLAQCTNCMYAYESMLRVMERMNQMGRIEEPADFLQGVASRLDEKFSLKRLYRRFFVPLRIKLPLELAGVAAAVVLVIHAIGIGDNQNLYEITLSMDGHRNSKVVERKGLEKGGESNHRDKKGPKRGTSLQDIICSLEGRVIEIQYCEGTKVPASMIAEIRADKYQALMEELERLGVIQKSSSKTFKDGGEQIRVKIVFQQTDPQ